MIHLDVVDRIESGEWLSPNFEYGVSDIYDSIIEKVKALLLEFVEATYEEVASEPAYWYMEDADGNKIRVSSLVFDDCGDEQMVTGFNTCGDQHFFVFSNDEQCAVEDARMVDDWEQVELIRELSKILQNGLDLDDEAFQTASDFVRRSMELGYKSRCNGKGSRKKKK